MFTFLRKVRRRILSENKLTRYLAYAIGEIILVVIGILIAIQLNDRKQQKDLQVEMNQLLHGVYQNLLADSANMAEINKYYLEHTEAIQNLLEVQTGNMEMDNVEIGKEMIRLFFFDNYEHIQSSYQSLISGGRLQYLDDSELSKVLVNYYNNNTLEVTTNIYGEILVSFDASINNSPNLLAMDRMIPENILKESISNYRLMPDTLHHSDFTKVLKEDWVDDFLVNSLNQSVFVFRSLAYTRMLNRQLREMISANLEGKKLE